MFLKTTLASLGATAYGLVSLLSGKAFVDVVPIWMVFAMLYTELVVIQQYFRLRR